MHRRCGSQSQAFSLLDQLGRKQAYHQVLPEPRSSGLRGRKGKKRQLLPKVAVRGALWSALCSGLEGWILRPPPWGQGVRSLGELRLAVPSQRWSPGALVCDTFVSGPGQDASPLPPAVGAGAPGGVLTGTGVHGVTPTVCSSACPVPADTRPRERGPGAPLPPPGTAASASTQSGCLPRPPARWPSLFRCQPQKPSPQRVSHRASLSCRVQPGYPLLLPRNHVYKDGSGPRLPTCCLSPQLCLPSGVTK